MEQLKKRFFDYVESYSSNDDAVNHAILLKRDHTRRVCRNARMLANKLQIPEKEARLAEIMALFHDIGRFKQYALYQTFRDADSEDHARLGVKEIRSHSMLSGLPEADEAVVCEVIAYHNAFSIPDHLSEHARFFLKLLRDADKLDIWKVFGEYYENRNAPETESVSLGLPDTEGYSRAALEAVCEARLVRIQDLQNLHDFLLLQTSWVYDLNFSPSVAVMLEKGYMDRLQANLPPTPEIERAFEIVFRYAETALVSIPDSMETVG